MTFVATRPHIAAVSGLLTAAGLAVLAGGAGDPVAPCVVLWPAPGTPTARTLADPTGDLVVDVTTVACGSTADQAMWVADKITATLSRAVPTVSGRQVMPIWLLDSTTVRRDDSLAAPTFSASLTWRLRTMPA